MNNTTLIGLSRQVTMRRELDVIANNVANITTTGFKRRGSTFMEYLIPVASADTMRGSQKKLSYVADDAGILDLSGGAIDRTGNPLDVALRGNGLIAVSTPAGERYTRDGAFVLNPAGTLVTQGGHPVLTDQGPLTFTLADGDIRIASDGTISTAQGARGKLRLVDAADPRMFENAGGNLYRALRPVGPAPLGVRLESGALERSNVNPTVEISRLIELNRSYGSIAQMLQRTDEMRRSTLSRLAEAA